LPFAQVRPWKDRLAGLAKSATGSTRGRRWWSRCRAHVRARAPEW